MTALEVIQKEIIKVDAQINFFRGVGGVGDFFTATNLANIKKGLEIALVAIKREEVQHRVKDHQ